MFWNTEPARYVVCDCATIKGVGGLCNAIADLDLSSKLMGGRPAGTITWRRAIFNSLSRALEVTYVRKARRQGAWRRARLAARRGGKNQLGLFFRRAAGVRFARRDERNRPTWPGTRKSPGPHGRGREEQHPLGATPGLQHTHHHLLSFGLPRPPAELTPRFQSETHAPCPETLRARPRTLRLAPGECPPPSHRNRA